MGFWKKSERRTEKSKAMEALNHFTPKAQELMALARKEADRFQHSFVGTEHLLLAIIGLQDGIAARVLKNLGLDLENVRVEIEQQIGRGPDEKLSHPIPYTPRVKKVVALAAKEAKALNHTYVGTEHVLLGLLSEGDGVAARVLNKFKVDVGKVRREILQQLDPNFVPAKGLVQLQLQEDAIDVSKRFDVYCMQGSQETVYRKALFKSRRALFPKDEFDLAPEFVELEQENGQKLFVAWSSIVKFCEAR